MAYHLAKPGSAQAHTPFKRFDPSCWSVNFPRPMMASVVTKGDHGLRVDCVFHKANNLCGLIWESEDRHDHPLLAYETSRDYRGCKLSFRWRSGGLIPLDGINGPVLTIEGRDAGGTARAWYVRLWNYAIGTPTDAQISLDFGALSGGFLLPQEADPVWAGDVDRMFISLVPPGYSGEDTLLAAPLEGWAELTEMACEGPGSVLQRGAVWVPPHDTQICTGYDDCYHLTPERVLRSIVQLGYRDSINHYVGMSHYPRLEAAAGGLYASLAGGAINGPCAAWHADFAARAKGWGYSLIVSLSYELFNEYCWNDWKQRAWNGDPALTGWVPPSTLLSPAHAGANAYLQSVARALVQIAVTAGHAPRFQIGEPWWWVMPDGRPCLYDDAAKAVYGGSPPEIATVRSASLTPAQTGLLDVAGAILASSTAALAAAVKGDHASCETLLLVYLPTVLDGAAPELKRANVPLGWAVPAFDVLQLEDYDWVTQGETGLSAAGAAAITQRLGYPVADQHYLSGFVLNPEDASQWSRIDAALDAARARGVPHRFVWALPQVLRDGYVHFSLGDEAVQPFDDVLFPLSIGRGASVEPGFSTQIVTTASGHEQRNAAWANARMRYDAGPGLRSEADVRLLIDFFRARRGAAQAFRFRDPLDHQGVNEWLGEGDGQRTRFGLVRRYGSGEEAEVRAIRLPVAGSVSVSINGANQSSGWALEESEIVFATPPASGAVIRASFLFDVPVRFADDSLPIDLATWAAGDAAQVPLIEVRI